MNPTRLAWPLVATAVLALATSAIADEVKDILKAKLVASADDPEPAAHGKAKRKTRFDPADFRDRFKTKVELPFPENAFGLTTRAAAGAADVRVVLSRAGTAYAVCFLLLEDDDDAHDAEIEFKADLRVRDGVLDRMRGQCDVDLDEGGVQNAIPDLRVDDFAHAFLMVDGTAISIASGDVVQIR